MRLILTVVFAASLVGCFEEGNPGVFCDGTSKFRCTNPDFPYCDLSKKRCIEMPDMTMCEASGSICVAPDMGDMGDMGVPEDMQCQVPCFALDMGPDLSPSCTTSAQCPDDKPICDAQHCRKCTGGGDDAECSAHSASNPRCEMTTGQCVVCSPANSKQSSDCKTATAPVCGTGNACRGCQSLDECTSLVCNRDGTCADGATVTYANNTNSATVTCSDAPHTSTPAAPYCEIQKAIDNLGAKTIVRVFPSAAAYGKLSVSSGGVSIIGPPATPTSCATAGNCVKISGDLSNPAVTVGGALTAVAFDGIEITAGGTGQNGIACNNATLGPSVAVRRSWIHAVSGIGINTTNCKLTADQVQLDHNPGGGVLLTGSQYAITNCFIFGNGTTGPGVTFGAGSSELAGGPGFAHNTVAKNVTLAGVGGIACNSGTTNITNSIVVSNTPTNTGGSGACNFINTVTTTTTGPDFVDGNGPAFDFHLAGRTANNLSCCIDQIASSPVLNDYDGRVRPINIKWDTGAHEVP